jgi:hypothetical protein
MKIGVHAVLTVPGLPAWEETDPLMDALLELEPIHGFSDSGVGVELSTETVWIDLVVEAPTPETGVTHAVDILYLALGKAGIDTFKVRDLRAEALESV